MLRNHQRRQIRHKVDSLGRDCFRNAGYRCFLGWSLQLNQAECFASCVSKQRGKMFSLLVVLVNIIVSCKVICSRLYSRCSSFHHAILVKFQYLLNLSEDNECNELNLSELDYRLRGVGTPSSPFLVVRQEILCRHPSTHRLR